MALLTNKFDSFGLDIGDQSIKAVFIRQKGSDFVLESFGSLEIDKNMFKNGSIVNPDLVGRQIRELLNKVLPKKISTKYVHACLPETHTFIKQLSIEAESQEELPARIREILPNHIPLDANESYIDFKTIDNQENGSSLKRVVVGAVPKQTSDAYNDMLLKIGLMPVSLQIEAEAIIRSLTPYAVESPANCPIAVIDIGVARSSFILFDNNTIQFTVSMPYSSDAMTEFIAKSLDLGKEDAEKAKKSFGLQPDKGNGSVAKILEPVVAELAKAIQKNIAFYSEHFQANSPVESIILTGGGAQLIGLKKSLHAKMPGLQFYFGNPLINLYAKRKKAFKGLKKSGIYSIADNQQNIINVPEQFDSSNTLAFSTAIGLALTNVI